MATVLRRRLLVNPARKRKNRKRRNRKMSPKQIRYFGTPAQKAALRANRKRKRRNPPRKTKAHRPRTRPRTAPRPKARRRRARKNVSEIITASLAGLANPARKRRKVKTNRKRKNMAAKARRSKKHAARRPSHAEKNYSRRRNRRNPSGRRRRHYTRHSHRLNPGAMSGIGSTIIDLGWEAAGAIGSRTLTQLVLSSNNTGVIGYGANLIAGFLLSWGTKALLKNNRAATEVMKGTMFGILLRALQDYTPLGQAAQLSGLGDFLATTFFSPRALVDPRSGQMIMPAQVTAMQTTKNTGMGSFYGRKMYGK